MALREQELRQPGFIPTLRELRAPTPVTWEQVLATDPNHEPHLETQEGRLNATLCVVKSGVFVAILSSMNSSGFEQSTEIAGRIGDKKYSGTTDIKKSLSTHLRHTLANVGTVKSGADKDFMRTPFGTEVLPPAFYLWQNILRMRIDPARALGSQTHLKRNGEKRVIGSSPYTRARIILQTSAARLLKSELARVNAINDNVISDHITNLEIAGLVAPEIKGQPIRLTDAGQEFAGIISNLYDWAGDITSVPDINDAKASGINSLAYDNLIQGIFRRYEETSPYVSKDLRSKMNAVETLMSKHPAGTLDASAIASTLKISPTEARSLVRRLANEGKLESCPVQNGRRPLFFVSRK